MVNSRLTAWLLAAALAAPAARALEVDGVTVPDTARREDGTVLLLNGAGTRVKFIVDVYVGALYLPARSSDAAAILAGPPANRVLMHFVHDEVDAESLRGAWRDGFEANLSAEELDALLPRIQKFEALFGDAVEGDVIALDFSPGAGTRVSHNGRLLGSVAGDDFNRALLAIWLGERPADRGLRKGMLGG